jgi:hypothetical protein
MGLRDLVQAGSVRKAPASERRRAEGMSRGLKPGSILSRLCRD